MRSEPKTIENDPRLDLALIAIGALLAAMRPKRRLAVLADIAARMEHDPAIRAALDKVIGSWLGDASI